MVDTRSYRQIVVVGASQCGKTCLIAMYCQNRFPDHEHRADGVKHVHVYGRDLKLLILDTGGLECHARSRSWIYPKSDVVLLCFAVNDRDSFNDVADDWITEIRTHRPHIPVILVGLKQDMRNIVVDGVGRDPVAHVEGSRLATEIGAVAYLECSAKNDTGLTAVFEAAAREALTHKNADETARSCDVM